MIFADLASGDSVFVDANTLIYHFDFLLKESTMSLFSPFFLSGLPLVSSSRRG
jgi:hypothetical protein